MDCVLISLMCHMGHTTCYECEMKDSPVCLKLTVKYPVNCNNITLYMISGTTHYIQHITSHQNSTKSINKQNPLELNEQPRHEKTFHTSSVICPPNVTHVPGEKRETETFQH